MDIQVLVCGAAINLQGDGRNITNSLEKQNIHGLATEHAQKKEGIKIMEKCYTNTA